MTVQATDAGTPAPTPVVRTHQTDPKGHHMSHQTDDDSTRLVLKLPTGFNPDKHTDALPEYAAKKTGKDGWTLVSIEDGQALMTRGSAATKVGAVRGRTRPLDLRDNVTLADGDRLAAKLADNYPGYVLTTFDPFNLRAVLTRLTPEEDRVRMAVANVLSVKPWDVQIEARADGGFDLELPHRYSTDRHKDALDKIAVEIAGTDGWYCTVNTKKLTASIIPAEPPTFPAVLDYPLNRLHKADRDRTVFGMALPEPGEKVGEPMAIDWGAQAFGLLAGMPESGKALDDDTPVPVPVSNRFPTGWARHGDLVVGDEVYAHDGDVVSVTEVTDPRMAESYRITFDDGQQIIADGEHLWPVMEKITPVPIDIDNDNLARLEAKAIEYCQRGSGIDVDGLAQATGLARATVAGVISSDGIRRAGRLGTANLYPGDEVLRAVVRHAGGFPTDQQRLITTAEMAASDRRWVLPSTKYGQRYITKIEPVGQRQVRCIRVNHPDHLYLVGDFIPTHNTVTLNDIIVGSLAGGAELSIIDVPHKRVDFLWCQDFCRPGGWGCESLEGAVAALQMLYNEGAQRAKVLAEHRVQNWKQLPPKAQFTPVLCVVDEVAGLLSGPPKPAGIPKDHPLMQDWLQENLLRVTLNVLIEKILAEHRFVGFRMLLSSQVTNNTTGVGPSKKSKMGHFILQGVSPSDTAKGQTFNDPKAVPSVPRNILADAKAGRGVGVADLTGGGGPKVYKSLYGDPDDFRAALERLGVAKHADNTPTPAQINRHTPSLDDDGSSDDGGFVAPSAAEAEKIRERMGDNWDVDPETGKRLTGYAKANQARHESARNND